MQTRGKKGISSVVTTVLFILIVVAAIAVISILIINLVGNLNKGTSASVACQKLEATPIECIYNNTDTYSRFSMQPDGINLVNLTMIYERETGSPVFKTIIGTDLENLTTTSFLFNDSENAISPPKTFSILPIILADNALYTCPQSRKINCVAPVVSNPGNSPISGGNVGFITNGSSPNTGIKTGGGGGGGGSGGGNTPVTPTVSNPISSCTTITSPGTYNIISNMGDGSESCITVKASDVVINGNGYTLTGDINQYNTLSGTTCQINKRLTVNDLTVNGNIHLYNHECGYYEAKGGTLSLVRSKVDEINAYGNSINDKITSSNAGYFVEQGTAGGDISLLNSEVNVISAYGGEAIGIAHSDYGEKGGNGGNINAVNSKITSGINAYGGDAYNRFDGVGGFHKAGNGGNVTLINSSTGYVEVFGGTGKMNYIGPKANGGNGGNIIYDCLSQPGDIYNGGGQGFVFGNAGTVVSQCSSIVAPTLSITGVTRDSNGNYLVAYAVVDNMYSGGNSYNPYNIKLMAGVPPFDGNEGYAHEEMTDFNVDGLTQDSSGSIMFYNNNCPYGDSISFYAYEYNVSNPIHRSGNSPVVEMLCSQVGSAASPSVKITNLINNQAILLSSTYQSIPILLNMSGFNPATTTCMISVRESLYYGNPIYSDTNSCKWFLDNSQHILFSSVPVPGNYYIKMETFGLTNNLVDSTFVYVYDANNLPAKYALEFNQTNSVATPNINLNGITQLTVSFWFNLKDGALGTGSSFPGLIRIFDQEWPAGAFTLHLLNDSTTGWKVKLGGQYNLDAYSGGVSPSGDVKPDQWYFATFTVNQTRAVIYLDGVAIASSSVINNGVNPDLNKKLYLGGSIGSITSYKNDFKGKLDEVKIYNRTLTQNEILQQYSSGNGVRGYPLENGLIAAWNFDEGTGNYISSYHHPYNGINIVNYNQVRWTGGIVPTI